MLDLKIYYLTKNLQLNHQMSYFQVIFQLDLLYLNYFALLPLISLMSLYNRHPKAPKSV